GWVDRRRDLGELILLISGTHQGLCNLFLIRSTPKIHLKSLKNYEVNMLCREKEKSLNVMQKQLIQMWLQEKLRELFQTYPLLINQRIYRLYYMKLTTRQTLYVLK